ncbi:MAG TPA: FtsX-like permease family protein [Verrucomicrobiae bacterium]
MSRLPFELLLALRYLRPKRTFVSVITLISVLGVSLGVAVLIIVISVMTGFDHDLRDKILGFTPHITINRPNATLNNYQALARLVSSNPHVKAVAPLALGRVLAQTEPPDTNYPARFDAPVMRGIDPKLEAQITTLPTNIVAGAFDVKDRGLLIGSVFAAHMGLQVGDLVTVYSPEELQKLRQNQGKEGERTVLPPEFEVRGIFDVGYEEYNAQYIITSLRDFQELYVLDDSVHALAVVTKEPYQAELIKNELQKAIGPEFEVSTWMDQNSALLGAVAVEKNVMFIILFCIMIVAALCILSALITFVVQKTREIGMLKALGAMDLQISGLFLSQSGFVGALGVSAGFVLGRVALAYRNEFLHFLRRTTGLELFPARIYGFSELPALIVPSDILLICGSAFVICLLGGVIPAWRAGRLKPVEALRYE